MLNYAIVEIAGKQVKVRPNQEFKVNYLGDVKSLECDKVLLISEGDKLSIGAPYLKNTLKFDILGTKRDRKIRVATYHAKANTRKVIGARQMYSIIKLVS